MFERTLLESHFNLIPFQVYIADMETYEIIFVNDLLFFTLGDLRGQKCHKALHGVDTPCAFCPNEHLLNEEGKPNGELYDYQYFNEMEDSWLQVKSRALGWSDGSIVQQSIRVDITDLKEAQSKLAEAHATVTIQNKKLDKISTTDGLTGLANRLRLDKLLKETTAKNAPPKGPISTILLDIDHFKLVNDTYGHNVGDMVLKRISNVLAKSVRNIDTPGRWGGEEFLIVMPDTDLMGASQMAEGLRRQIEAMELPKVGHKTASFGVAQFQPGESIDSFINRADTALYEAKETGRNKVVAK